MKKKRIKSKNKDIGFISSNGICIDGDILMNCEREHNSGSFLWFQILLTFVTTICTAFMAVSFLDMEIYKTTIIYYSAMLSLVFGLMKSSHKIIKFSALGVMILHVIYLVSRISTIKYGLFVDLPSIHGMLHYKEHLLYPHLSQLHLSHSLQSV